MPAAVAGDDDGLVYVVELVGGDIYDQPVLFQPGVLLQVGFSFAGHVVPLAVPGLMQVLAEKDGGVPARPAREVAK